jgi:lipopolysaccharide/colanic/teichoic acid biosynthesis glycosyltransferase
MVAERLEDTGMAEVVGFLDDFSPNGMEVYGGKRVLGPPSHYREIAKEVGASLAIMIPDANSWETRREVLSTASTDRSLELQIAPGLSDLHLASMQVGFRGNMPLLRFKPGYVTGLDAILKFAMDYAFGIFFLVLTLPTMIAISLVLLVSGGWPIFETFKTMGKNGRVFLSYKFRTGLIPRHFRSLRSRVVTMAADSREPGSVERLLFRTGLDKLPQIFNVLAGQMSIVGPRTLSLEALRPYGKWLSGLLAVKPGITGSWALHEVGDLDQEISLTLHYVRNWNIWTDFVIIGQTIIQLVRTRFRTRMK